jgi:N-acyl-phosphatidylethanolamine-hydrolysing phospholipase D
VRKLLGALLGLGLALPASGQSPLTPAPRDAEGRFLNRAGEIPQAGPTVTFPFFLRRFGTTLTGRPGAPSRVENDGAYLRENARHSTPTITWIGHATLLVQMDHVTFLTDPIWSDRASPVPYLGPSRFVPPGLALDALPPIDFVVVSHDHYDHMDLDTLSALSQRNPEARFFVPLGNAELLRDVGIEAVEELDWGGRAQVKGVEIVCVPVQHWGRRSLLDARQRLWSGWVVLGPGRRFYFGGDAGYSADYREVGTALGPFDLAALSIGAYEPAAMMRPWHLTPEEAVQAGLELGARSLVPIHFGTFDLSDEPLDEPPRRFRAAASAAGFDPEKSPVLQVGETRPF